MRRLVIALVAVLGACGEPYSNDDLLFVRSVPDRDKVQIKVPDQGMGDNPGEIAKYYLQAREISLKVNQGIFGVLNMVGEISSNPPSARQDDVRSWGPIRTGTIAEFGLYIARTSTPGVRVPTATTTILPVKERFDFALYGLATGAKDSLQIIGGSYAPIDESGGVGGFYVDNEAYHRIIPTSPDRGWFWAGYDTRNDGVSLVLGYVAPMELGGGSFDSLNAYYRFNQLASGAVDFAYMQRSDLAAPTGPPISALETYVVIARWQADQRGRADVLYTGGDLTVNVTANECWDEHFRRVYFAASTPDLGNGVGSNDSCAEALRTPLYPR